MRCTNERMRLYAVTDRRWLGGHTLSWQVEAAVRGGVTCVQLREKELAGEAFLAEALEIRELCGKYGVPFIINDNADVALACGADGIHVGQQDMEAADVRALAGSGRIVGVSVQTVEQALAAEAAGADYLGAGAVFPTATKADAKCISRQTLTDICSSVKIPVVAIGGISRDNIAALAGTGVDGVALVSAIFSAERITEECRLLRRLSERMVAG